MRVNALHLDCAQIGTTFYQSGEIDIRRSGGMVSLISVISTIGIALGVAVLIVGLSAMNGFERELNNRILAVVPHGEIEAVDQPWTNWQEALDKVQKVPGIAAAPPSATKTQAN
ncbi:hypothetical protein [Escherichia coli]|uniref:hypothetical protein n=1 Tax=Escherichia coli TaxID=562 RepID=UPI003D80AE3A